MNNRRIAVAILLSLFAWSLHAQTFQQKINQPTPQARQELTKTLQEYRTKKDAHGEAVTLLQLGLTEAGLGNISGARSNLTESIEKMRALNDFVGAWMGLVALGQIEAAVGRLPEAIAHIERALKWMDEEKTSKTPFSMKTFMALGAVSGVTPEMMKMIDGNPAMKVLMIQYTFEPVTHDLYGSVLIQAGQLDKAESELNKAVAGAAMAQGIYDFSIESHFGDLRFRQQRYDEARTHYIKSLDAAGKAGGLLAAGTDQQLKTTIYDRLVRLETAAGRPDDAKRWAEKARELGRKTPAGR